MLGLLVNFERNTRDTRPKRWGGIDIRLYKVINIYGTLDISNVTSTGEL